MRVAMLLDVPTPALILHADGAEHDEQWRGCDPLLPVGLFGDLFDEVTIGDDAEHPGLFVAARGGKSCSFEHILYHFLRDSLILEASDTDALF
jgi:hypothetical protein